MIGGRSPWRPPAFEAQTVRPNIRRAYVQKIFEYAGPYKKNMYVATVVVLVSVLMGVLPFVLAYQVISPLVMGDSVETGFVLLRVIGVLICLILQAVLYGWGLSISHKAAYNTLVRMAIQNFSKNPVISMVSGLAG